MRNDLPKRSPMLHWLENLILTGREEDDPYERDAQGAIIEEDGEKVLKEGWEYDDEDKPVKVEEVDDEALDDKSKESEEDDLEKKLADVEEALRKERQLRRKAEREARKAAKKKPGEPKKGADDETQKQLQDAQRRTERLAEGLLNARVEQALLEEARRQGFIDPTDVLTDTVRREVDYDQDEEDPSDIDIDLDSVKDAVADLANRKKHLVGKGTPGERSGSRQRRRKSGESESLSEQALRERYAGLR